MRSKKFDKLFVVMFLLSVAILMAFALFTPASAQGTFSLKLVPKGGMARAEGCLIQALTLTTTRPVGVMKVPDGVTSPLYGVFEFGPGVRKASVIVLLDEPALGKPRLFIDGDEDGDLTDDPILARSPSPYKDTMGTTRTMYRWQGSVLMPLVGNGAAVPVTISFERYDQNDPESEQPKDTLFYLPDYLSEGKATLGGKAYRTLLQLKDVTGNPVALDNLFLLIDVNGDGHFHGRNEQYGADKPFNIGGTTYEVGAVSADGSQVTFMKSQKRVAETTPSPDLDAGRMAIPFSAKATDGRTIDLSRDYKRRLVLLDFWASWCIPCVAEQPGIVQAYKALHGRGFDVLGISLDNKDASSKLTAFMKKRSMVWPQIYDGGGFKSRIALLYGIDSIPALILVDGDTGRIVADSATLRGDQLAPTLIHALALKKRASTATAKDRIGSEVMPRH